MKLIAKNVKKDFPRASKSSNYFTAVQSLDFELESGKMIEITGRSGSGKSTLLNILAGMLTPTAGKVLLDNTDLYALEEKSLSRLRLLVTHENEAAQFADQVYTMDGGKLVES